MDAKKQHEKQFDKLTKEVTGKSPVIRNFFCAWLIGGLICVVGQGILDFYGKVVGLNTEQASTATSITLVFLGSLLTALKLYYKLAKIGGAGTLVPITGFSNAMTSPAMEFRTDGMILGIGVKMFTITGPVIAYGTAAAALYGIILFIINAGGGA